MSAPTRVLLVGAGGIGHPAAVSLATLRVEIVVLDDDRVEQSNLHRLPFADERDVGRPKAEVAVREVIRRGGNATVRFGRIEPGNALALVRAADLVIEGSDNYATKFLVADACHIARVPCVHGAAVGWLGTVLATVPGRTACYRCVFEDVPDGDAIDCASAGVYGPVTALVGGLMAAEAARIVAHEPDPGGVLGSYDALRNTFRAIRVRPRADCALCGARTIATLDPARYAPAVCTI